MPRPLRLTYVIQNLNYGGMERILHGLASRLPQDDFDIHIVALQYLGRFADGLQSAATLHSPPPMGRFSLLRPRRLATVLSSIAPDIVHSHSGVWLKSARAARMARVPVVIHTEHGRQVPIPLADRLLDHLASRLTDVVVAVSDPMADLLRREIISGATPIRTIANGVDVGQFKRSGRVRALRAKLALPESALVIGSIGRLEPVKNYALALESLALARAARPDLPITLLLAGDGSQRGMLEGMSVKLGIAGHVKFLGWQDDAVPVYEVLDLFTLTSDSEGTSVSLLEAMSMEVCPAVTDVGGNRAALGPSLASHAVPPGSPGAMCELWLRLLCDPGARAAAAARAREHVVSNFSLAAMVEAHASLYNDLVRSRRAAPVPSASAGS